jgi:hypothetical protein
VDRINPIAHLKPPFFIWPRQTLASVGPAGHSSHRLRQIWPEPCALVGHGGFGSGPGFLQENGPLLFLFFYFYFIQFTV